MDIDLSSPHILLNKIKDNATLSKICEDFERSQLSNILNGSDALYNKNRISYFGGKSYFVSNYKNIDDNDTFDNIEFPKTLETTINNAPLKN